MGLLPNAEKAEIRLEKLRDYSLDRDHPTGKHKARVFESAMGLTDKDAERLRDLIAKAILWGDAVSNGINEHGERFAVDFSTLGLRGQVVIRTAWIIDNGESIPRLTSCYIIE